MQKLYKKTSTGATQVWFQELVGNKYRTHSGKLDGKMVVSAWTVCEGKANVMGDRAYLRNMLENKSKFIGKEATVIFFHYTPDGKPRFGRLKVIHESARW